jgi:hypothetical protein
MGGIDKSNFDDIMEQLEEEAEVSGNSKQQQPHDFESSSSDIFQSSGNFPRWHTSGKPSDGGKYDTLESDLEIAGNIVQIAAENDIDANCIGTEYRYLDLGTFVVALSNCITIGADFLIRRMREYSGILDDFLDKNSEFETNKQLIAVGVLDAYSIPWRSLEIKTYGDDISWVTEFIEVGVRDGPDPRDRFEQGLEKSISGTMHTNSPGRWTFTGFDGDFAFYPIVGTGVEANCKLADTESGGEYRFEKLDVLDVETYGR